MSKLMTLIGNELTKFSKRVSIIVILAITFAGSLLIGFGVLAVTNLTTSDVFSNDMTEYYENEITQMKSDIASLEEKLAEAESPDYPYPDDAFSIRDEIENLRYSVSVNEMTIESGLAITPNDLPYFLYEIIDALARAENYPLSVGYTPSEEDIAQLKRIYSEIDYLGWIEYQKEHLGYEYTDEEEYRIRLDALSLKAEADPDGVGEFSDIIDYIASCRIALLNNRTMDTNRPLSAEERREYENAVAVNTYYVKNGIYSSSVGSMALSVMDSFGVFMVTLLAIILAGGSISGELSTGSIKSLIIAPVRRWKIFTSKVIALVVTGLAAIIAVCVFNSLAGLVMYGDTSFTPYVYAVNGVARVIPAPLYRLLYSVIGYADIMVFTFFAFMLSTVTRNTAASVGVSMAIYFGGGLISELLLIFSSDVLDNVAKFMPSENLGLASRVFTDFSMYGGTGDLFGTASGNLNSVAFSLCYLAAASLCMLLTAFDSFTKRDI